MIAFLSWRRESFNVLRNLWQRWKSAFWQAGIISFLLTISEDYNTCGYFFSSYYARKSFGPLNVELDRLLFIDNTAIRRLWKKDSSLSSFAKYHKHTTKNWESVLRNFAKFTILVILTVLLHPAFYASYFLLCALKCVWENAMVIGDRDICARYPVSIF